MWREGVVEAGGLQSAPSLSISLCKCSTTGSMPKFHLSHLQQAYVCAILCVCRLVISAMLSVAQSAMLSERDPLYARATAGATSALRAVAGMDIRPRLLTTNTTDAPRGYLDHSPVIGAAVRVRAVLVTVYLRYGVGGAKTSKMKRISRHAHAACSGSLSLDPPSMSRQRPIDSKILYHVF